MYTAATGFAFVCVCVHVCVCVAVAIAIASIGHCALYSMHSVSQM